MKALLVYSPEYDLRLPGQSLLHPFDGRKYGHAWAMLQQRFGPALDDVRHDPGPEIPRDDLLLVHESGYLDSLRHPAVVARALEAPVARFLPSALLSRYILRPMRFATQGTVTAVRCALDGQAVFNLGGGYHHAFPDHGEGFCIYADVAIALIKAWKQGWLAAEDKVLVIDLDAHRGNGTEHIFRRDPRVRFFDMYNFQVYPGYADSDDEFLIPVPARSTGNFYLERLKKELPAFLASAGQARLAVYNAGTDVVAGDRIGHLNLAEEDVRERDRYVLGQLLERGLPTVMLTSGGYSSRSAGLIADAAAWLVQNSGNRPCSHM